MSAGTPLKKRVLPKEAAGEIPALEFGTVQHDEEFSVDTNVPAGFRKKYAERDAARQQSKVHDITDQLEAQYSALLEEKMSRIRALQERLRTWEKNGAKVAEAYAGDFVRLASTNLALLKARLYRALDIHLDAEERDEALRRHDEYKPSADREALDRQFFSKRALPTELAQSPSKTNVLSTSQAVGSLVDAALHTANKAPGADEKHEEDTVTTAPTCEMQRRELDEAFQFFFEEFLMRWNASRVTYFSKSGEKVEDYKVLYEKKRIQAQELARIVESSAKLLQQSQAAFSALEGTLRARHSGATQHERQFHTELILLKEQLYDMQVKMSQLARANLVQPSMQFVDFLNFPAFHAGHSSQQQEEIDSLREQLVLIQQDADTAKQQSKEKTSLIKALETELTALRSEVDWYKTSTLAAIAAHEAAEEEARRQKQQQLELEALHATANALANKQLAGSTPPATPLTQQSTGGFPPEGGSNVSRKPGSTVSREDSKPGKTEVAADKINLGKKPTGKNTKKPGSRRQSTSSSQGSGRKQVSEVDNTTPVPPPGVMQTPIEPTAEDSTVGPDEEDEGPKYIDCASDPIEIIEEPKEDPLAQQLEQRGTAWLAHEVRRLQLKIEPMKLLQAEVDHITELHKRLQEDHAKANAALDQAKHNLLAKERLIKQLEKTVQKTAASAQQISAREPPPLSVISIPPENPLPTVIQSDRRKSVDRTSDRQTQEETRAVLSANAALIAERDSLVRRVEALLVERNKLMREKDRNHFVVEDIRGGYRSLQDIHGLVLKDMDDLASQLVEAKRQVQEQEQVISVHAIQKLQWRAERQEMQAYIEQLQEYVDKNFVAGPPVPLPPRGGGSSGGSSAKNSHSSGDKQLKRKGSRASSRSSASTKRSGEPHHAYRMLPPRDRAVQTDVWYHTLATPGLRAEASIQTVFLPPAPLEVLPPVPTLLSYLESTNTEATNPQSGGPFPVEEVAEVNNEGPPSNQRQRTATEPSVLHGSLESRMAFLEEMYQRVLDAKLSQPEVSDIATSPRVPESQKAVEPPRRSSATGSATGRAGRRRQPGLRLQGSGAIPSDGENSPHRGGRANSWDSSLSDSMESSRSTWKLPSSTPGGSTPHTPLQEPPHLVQSPHPRTPLLKPASRPASAKNTPQPSEHGTHTSERKSQVTSKRQQSTSLQTEGERNETFVTSGVKVTPLSSKEPTHNVDTTSQSSVSSKFSDEDDESPVEDTVDTESDVSSQESEDEDPFLELGGPVWEDWMRRHDKKGTDPKRRRRMERVLARGFPHFEYAMEYFDIFELFASLHLELIDLLRLQRQSQRLARGRPLRPNSSAPTNPQEALAKERRLLLSKFTVFRGVEASSSMLIHKVRKQKESLLRSREEKLEQVLAAIGQLSSTSPHEAKWLMAHTQPVLAAKSPQTSETASAVVSPNKPTDLRSSLPPRPASSPGLVHTGPFSAVGGSGSPSLASWSSSSPGQKGPHYNKVKATTELFGVRGARLKGNSSTARATPVANVAQPALQPTRPRSAVNVQDSLKVFHNGGTSPVAAAKSSGMAEHRFPPVLRGAYTAS
eukprot:TRINITY_DN4537_c0_g1_i2.p1 TRINITY_DN4537_c0_g1~~TRINITY_DN4537_c0_g1_i2.p1  ORF type:complete len:1562 (-),score=289.66 TRINITY_DN4537_c0_g1_i2:15-4700(-)